MSVFGKDNLMAWCIVPFDANKRGPGFGDTDFVSVMRTLKELNYDRYVSVEVFEFEPDPRTIAAGSIKYLRGILDAL